MTDMEDMMAGMKAATGAEKGGVANGVETTMGVIRNEAEGALEIRSSRTNETKGERVMIKRHRLLSFLLCIALVAAFVGCASTPTRESSGQYVDDSVITTKVKAAILDDPALKVFQINVETFKGEVQLSGFVDSAKSVSRAGEVARGVTGVKSVKNNLIVK
ncbi:MAG: BON domain-containing protein [bacterium]|jgi:hypothetical protein